MDVSYLLDSLNDKQREAVAAPRSNLLVLAGAGSGKTRVLVHRIAWLMSVENCSPYSIMAVTFTNKAAAEMRHRIGQLMGTSQGGMWVGTFHGLAHRLLRAHHMDANLPQDFQILDSEDQLRLLKRLIKAMNLDEKQWPPRQAMWYINSQKDEGLRPHHIQSYGNPVEQTWQKVYQAYQEACDRAGLVDFAELLLRAHELWLNKPHILQHYRERFTNILVDEFQDTNNIQYAWIRLLAGDTGKVMIVGDDDQSIYAWRGARPQNLVLLSQDFPALKVIKLEQNYRSSGRILKAANILIANNPHVFEKRLFSELGYGAELKVLSANNEEHEAERVTGELIAHHFVNKTQYKDYAILYRGNHQSRVFEKFLMQNRIPYKISGGTSFFSRPEIKDLLAYLRVLTNPDDDSAFLRIVNTPKREIGPATLKKLGEWAMTRNKSMFTASFDMGLSQTLSGRGYEALTRFTHWLAEIQRLAEREPIAAVRDLIHGMDYESWLYETSPSPKAAEMRMKNVNQLFSWMTEMLEGSELDEPMTLTQVVTRFTLRDMMERGESEEELDQVQLMTLHASKGLEFPYVYMVGMEEGFLPHQSSIDEDNIDEERRLAYVGITRAQKELTFTLCKERRQYGELVRPEPSRFLLELPQDDLIWEQERKVVSAEERMQKGQSHLANLKAMMAAKRGK